MSQSGSHENDAVLQSGMRAGSALLQMLAEGRSYSGRERNCCFLNTGADTRSQGRFANISAASGLDFIDDARGIALVDWDQDGDWDMWNSNRNGPRLRFLRNNIEPRTSAEQNTRSVSFELIGNGTTANRDAIGARVELVLADEASEADSRKSVQSVRAGDGFLAQSSKQLIFGLGSATEVEKVVVYWPGSPNEPESFSLTSGVGHHFRLEQGSGEAVPIERDRPITLETGELETLAPSASGRIPLQVLLQAPELRYVDYGDRNRFKAPAGKSLLVNLWASNCLPCVKELTEFSERADELRRANIEILALSLDALIDDGDVEASQALLKRIGLPFENGLATAGLMESLQELHDHLMPLHSALPVPTSFLIDSDGLLSVIYKGPVSVDQIIADRDHSKRSSLERFASSGALPGSTIDHPVISESIMRLEAATRDLFAKRLESEGKLGQAVDQFREIIKLKPDYPYAHHVIGRSLTDRGRLEDARLHYLNSLEVLPEDVNLHTALANVYILERSFERAEFHCQRAVAIQPDSSEFHVNLGNVYLQQRKTDEARAHYETAIGIDGDNAQARHNLGTILFQQKNYSQAKTQFLEAIRVQPDYAQAHFNVASIYAIENDLGSAKQHYEAALAIDPSFSQARAGLTRVLQQMRGGQ